MFIIGCHFHCITSVPNCSSFLAILDTIILLCTKTEHISTCISKAMYQQEPKQRIIPEEGGVGGGYFKNHHFLH